MIYYVVMHVTPCIFSIAAILASLHNRNNRGHLPQTITVAGYNSFAIFMILMTAGVTVKVIFFVYRQTFLKKKTSSKRDTDGTLGGTSILFFTSFGSFIPFWLMLIMSKYSAMKHLFLTNHLRNVVSCISSYHFN